MQMLFALFGGLAMFLYGMDRMSRALQRAAGDAMKRLLARLTATPLLGVLTGLAVTAVLQSSSAATVMVIGFVSAGLLELPRAVAVIYGINIGTTMTAQLIAFDAQQLVYPVLFAGFVIDFAARKARWQAVGEAVFSFGLLFEGIGILGGALQPLAGQEVFLGWMTRVKESPLLGILLGLSMTMVVQSSSATIALLQNVARQAGPDGIHSVLGLAGAVPVLLGDNIGTTVTALLACIGQGKDAARAALAHSCFNLSGSLLAAVLLPWFVRLVELISPKGPELEVISRQIANAHTAFNVCCALLWLPLLPWMVRLVCALADDAQGRGADGDGLRVGAEQADEGTGDGQAEDGANGHDGGAQAQRQVVEPGDAAMLPCTVVIADQWTHSLHDAVGGQVQKGLEFVVDAKNRDVAL